MKKGKRLVINQTRSSAKNHLLSLHYILFDTTRTEEEIPLRTVFLFSHVYLLLREHVMKLLPTNGHLFWLHYSSIQVLWGGMETQTARCDLTSLLSFFQNKGSKLERKGIQNYNFACGSVWV
jgi:hypothetical protein